VFIDQGLNAQLAHPLVDSQSLHQSSDLSLGIVSFNLILVPNMLVHDIKLILDILDGFCANHFEPSFQLSCDFLELLVLLGFNGPFSIALILHEHGHLNIVLIFHECLQIL
jgi:hypothetical protein